jgi:NADPH-dependent 2,4-dienoyl-CoA reductase/sulfur reductase-like enzyme
MCWGRRYRDYWISCLVNPSAGREFEWNGDRFTPAAKPRRILVVGGGPSGLETARVAASRGHKVTLAEASDRLGGQFRLAGMQPRRTQILDLLAWYETQLQKLQVTIRLNTYMEPDEVRSFGADAVVIATGSLPAGTGMQRWLSNQETLPGIDKPNVWSVEDVMSRSARPGKRVLLLDDTGNWRGVGTAWHLAEQGHEVTIVTPDPAIGREIARTSADLPARQRLRKLGARFVTESAVAEWHGDGATILDFLTGETERLPFDALVLATTNVAEDSLARALEDSGLEVHTVGDCLAPRHAPAATYEGRKLGLEL